MSNLSKPKPGEYIIIPPKNEKINDYLAQRKIYDDTKAKGSADPNKTPELNVRINDELMCVGVYPIDHGLLCTYVLPPDNDDKGRLFFAFTSKGSEPSREWTLHPVQLVTLIDGDNDLLRPNGPTMLLRKLLSQH